MAQLDLVSLYEQTYLNPQVSNSSVISEKKDAPSGDEDYEANEGGKQPKAAPAKKKKKMTDDEVGAWCYESNKFNKAIASFMEEFEMGDNTFSTEHDGEDNTFDFEGGEEEKDSYTLEELRSMTLGELADLLAGKGDEEGGDDFDFGGDEDDTIPTESYGHMGGGQHLGNTQTRDGKPSKQPSTTRVKANGDADFSKQDTGFEPEDTEGSEGGHLGNTQTRDGKPSKQPETSRVKSNGDADFSKQKTGFGKKQGERLF